MLGVSIVLNCLPAVVGSAFADVIDDFFCLLAVFPSFREAIGSARFGFHIIRPFCGIKSFHKIQNFVQQRFIIRNLTHCTV